MWRKTTAKSAHKTSDHKTKDQLVATADPQPLLSQVQQCWSVNSNTTIPKSDLTPEQEEIAMNFHKASGIPVETLHAQMLSQHQQPPEKPSLITQKAAKSTVIIEEIKEEPVGKLQMQIPTMNNFTYDDGEDVFEDATEGTISNQTMDHWFNNCSLPTMTNYVQSDDDEVSVTSFCTCLEVEDDLLDEDNISSHDETPNTHVSHTLWHFGFS